MRITKSFPAIVISYLLGLGACGGGSDTDMRNPDMSTTSGDMSSRGDDGGSGSCFPSCITSVLDKCQVTMPCTTQTSGTTQSFCGPNSIVYTAAPSANGTTGTITVTKSGTECYHESVTAGAQTSSMLFMPGSTTPFATVSGPSNAATVTCGGKSYTVNTTLSGCANVTTLPTGCAMGTCP